VASVSDRSAADLQALFEARHLRPPAVVLQAQSVLSMLVALTSTDLLALLPLRCSEFPLASNALTAIALKEQLLAPPIVLARRSDTPLTPAARFLLDAVSRHLRKP
jgi:DNA-binding transcriptional LysR family regulator